MLAYVVIYTCTNNAWKINLHWQRPGLERQDVGSTTERKGIPQFQTSHQKPTPVFSATVYLIYNGAHVCIKISSWPKWKATESDAELGDQDKPDENNQEL